MSVLTERWYPLRTVAAQVRFAEALRSKRFVIGCAGRRSGKTEHVKREGVESAISFHSHENGRFIFGAPTTQQAKDIWWEDLKALVPDWALLRDHRRSIYESSPQRIELYNGVEIIVMGMDKSKRAEGAPIDWIALDEYADMKPEVWTSSILPAVSTAGRPGRVRFLGKPRGRNHYFQLVQQAKADTTGLWSYHHWTSAEVLSAEEIEVLAQNMDSVTYAQEVLGDFVNFSGRAYYPFDSRIHVLPLRYLPDLDLIVMMDFNRSPGTATIAQEQPATLEMRTHLIKHGCVAPPIGETVTCILAEIYIPEGSNSVMVAQRVAADWAHHRQDVYLYGDPAGGARSSSSVLGSDWDLVVGELKPVYGDRLMRSWARTAPPVRSRINAVNTRLRTQGNRVGLLVDPRCKKTIEDFEGVVLVDRTGDLDKTDLKLTHLTDGIGYYIHRRYPIGASSSVEQF